MICIVSQAATEEMQGTIVLEVEIEVEKGPNEELGVGNKWGLGCKRGGRDIMTGGVIL